jgi:hypothetical protein
MSVSRDIVATWRRPRTVMRSLLAQGRREDRALMFLILACGIIFVSQWPVISREAALDARGRAATGAARDHLLRVADDLAARLLRARQPDAPDRAARWAGGQFYSARLALFWTLLASAPAWLFYGLVRGFIGPGPAQTLVGIGLVLAFVTIWGICLSEAEFSPEAEAAHDRYPDARKPSAARARHGVEPSRGAATMLSYAPVRQALWLMFALDRPVAPAPRRSWGWSPALPPMARSWGRCRTPP